MAKLSFNHAKITCVCTVVPQQRIYLDDEVCYYDDATKLQRLKIVVGLNSRTVAPCDVTPSDLMYDAARRLITDMGIDSSSIDALVCVLDNPDYKCPPTACILQGRLGLSEHCMSFDITHGCAGYVYGLSVASSLIESGLKRVLLLVGDTKTHTINIKDRVSAPIFGDGAAATLVEFSEKPTPSWFVLGTVGKSFENIMIPAGGARIPYSSDTAQETTDEFGNVRSLNQFRMNGRNVFDFTMTYVPQNIKSVMDFAGKNTDEIDFFILHQANKSIIKNITSRAGVTDPEKVPTRALSEYGNLAVASIPSAISNELFGQIENKTILLSGFGVGLSYGSAIIHTDSIFAPETFIYQGE